MRAAIKKYNLSHTNAMRVNRSKSPQTNRYHWQAFDCQSDSTAFFDGKNSWDVNAAFSFSKIGAKYLLSKYDKLITISLYGN